jgi:hypothetical protein
VEAFIPNSKSLPVSLDPHTCLATGRQPGGFDHLPGIWYPLEKDTLYEAIGPLNQRVMSYTINQNEKTGILEVQHFGELNLD